MKKLLLLSAMAIGLASANAATFSDLYNVTYEGQPVQNGQYIYVDHFDKVSGWFDADVTFTLKGSHSSAELTWYADYTGDPSYAMQSADPEAWGIPSVCYSAGSAGENCQPNEAPIISTKTLATTDPIIIQFHVLSEVMEPFGPDFNPSDPTTYPDYMAPANTSHYIITYSAKVDGAAASDSFTIHYVMGQEASVIGVTVDDAQAVYYDLQGRKVASPAKGQLVIEVKGGKSTKKIMM